jgi:hypothetical protein
MIKSRLLGAVLGGCLSFAALPAFAGIAYDQNVTNNVIFGSGNANGGFTTDTETDSALSTTVELGLRAKIRFPSPENTFLSQHNGTYGNFAAGGPGGVTPNWSFEWSINSDVAGTSGVALDALTYVMSIDSDPSAATSFFSFYPISPNGSSFFDNAIGNNSTGNGGGTEASTLSQYNTLIGSNNLAQNSWRMDFFTAAPLSPAFNPNLPGTYTIQLAALDGSNQVAQVSIDVVVAAVPESSGLLTWAGLATCFGLVFGWRRSRAAVAV